MSSLLKSIAISVGAVILLLSCHNQLSTHTKNHVPEDILVRAVVPSDALVLSDTTTIFEFENNQNYVIPNGTTIRTGIFNSTSYEAVNLYIEGTWDIPESYDIEYYLTLPTGLGITILDGGELLTRLSSLYILEETNILVNVGGTFRTESPANIYLGLYNEPGGLFLNYGTSSVLSFDARYGYFYNLDPGVFQYYSFNKPLVSSQYANTGTMVDLHE